MIGILAASCFLYLGCSIVQAYDEMQSEPVYYDKESDVPKALVAATHHVMMSMRWDRAEDGPDARFIVLNGDWNLDGVMDVAITMPGYCGGRCCGWYLYIATESGEHIFLDTLMFGDIPPRPIHTGGQTVELVVHEACAPRSSFEVRYKGSPAYGLEEVERITLEDDSQQREE